jgi:O-antigen/teichoic acid export membrane protein
MTDNVKRDYIWNTIGVLLQNAISPLLLIVITRLNGINDSGLFSFAFSVAIIFWVISMWGGRTYQVSDVNREFPHRSYITVRLILTILAIIGAVLFCMANDYDYVKTSLILLLVLFKAVESIADAIHGVLQVNDRLYVVGQSLIYKAVAGFIAFVVIDFLTLNVLLGGLGIVIANLLIVWLYDLPRARRLESINIPLSQIKQVVRSAITIMQRTWPVFIVIFLSMFSLNIPRYFIDLYHEEQIGYFGILAMPITLIGMVMMFVLQPQVVYLSKVYDQKEYTKFKITVRRLMFVTVVIGLIILVGAYFIGVPVFGLLFGVDFSHYLGALVIIVIGGIINAIVSIFINIFTIIRRFKQQFYILLITNILLAIFSAPFVHMYGLNGGVILFTVANIVQLALMMAAYIATFRQHTKRLS